MWLVLHYSNCVAMHGINSEESWIITCDVLSGECFPGVQRNEAPVSLECQAFQDFFFESWEPLTKGHGVTSQKTRIQRMRRVAHVVSMGERWSVGIILVRNTKGRRHFENLNVDGRIVGPVNIHPRNRLGRNVIYLAEDRNHWRAFVTRIWTGLTERWRIYWAAEWLLASLKWLRYIMLGIVGVIPQSIQFQTQVKLASLGWCHKSRKCAKSCARRSLCLCGGASIGLLT